MKKTLMLLLVTLLLPMSVAAQELYAVLSSDQKTLTFYYDTNRSSRSGMVYEYKFIEIGGYWVPTWCISRATVTKVVFDQSMTSARPTGCHGWFYNFEKLEQIENLEYLNTQDVTDMRNMFFDCSNLTTLDVSHFDISKCKKISGMFLGCSSLISLDVSHFDTSQCESMNCMFFWCSSLISLDVSNFDTSKCEDMEGMFLGCSSLTSLDLTSFRFENVKNIRQMFNQCSKLKTIYCNYDLSKFTFEKTEGLFNGCTALTGLFGTSFNGDGNDLTYARPDLPGHPGYFTPKDCIFVDGELVTGNVPSNYVSRIEEGSAYVTYSAEDQKLTMSNASLTTMGDGLFIPNAVEIELLGQNKITTDGNAITVFNDDCFISGNGSLNIFSINGYGISSDGTVEASGTGRLDIYGKLGALDGGKWTDNAGNVNYGTLAASQEILLRSDGQHPVVHDLGMIDMNNCAYNYDTYSFTTVAHSVIDTYSKKPVTKPFRLVPKDQITYYPVKIGGQRLNTHNASDFNPMSLASGSVTFNRRFVDRFDVLTLNDAKFVDYAADWDVGLEVNLQKFELQLKGNNSLVGNDETSLYGITFGEDGVDGSVKRDWRIKGVTGDDGKPATLKCSGAICFESTDNEAGVTFTNVNLTDEKEAYMWSQDDVNVTFDNCSVDLWDKRENPGYTGSIMEALGVVTLNGCHFENGCYWDAENSRVHNSSGKPEQRHICIRREGESAWLLGDVNGDGNINSADVQKVYALMAQNADGNNHPEADVNGDGYVNSADIQKIYAIMASI